jgi:putative ABC transport system ATP-binding protein
MSSLPRDQIAPDLFRFVWRHSRLDQLMILAMTLLGLPLLYLSLELPKIIVNDAIQGEAFPRSVMGREVAQIPYLLGLCGLFFATVIAINGVKWLTNMAVGLTGERLLRRLRFSFFQQTLRFPPQRVANARPGEVVQSVMAEIEPLGGFVGELFATPASQGGMLAVMLGFIFVQDPLLGLAASAMLPVQAIVIPMLQRRVIRLNRQRALNNRRLADTLASAVGAMPDIRAHGIQRWHLARIAGQLHTNTEIRKDIFRRKFTIKFINNLLNQITPFMFFAIGGSMVIRGQLDLGALVAVLTAYKDIGKPWRELLTYYQRLSDFRARFQHVAEGFAGFDLMPASRIEAAPEPVAAGTLALRDVEISAAGSLLEINGLAAVPGQSVVLSGGSQEAREAIMRTAAGLDPPMRGRVLLGDIDLAALTPAAIGLVAGQVDADPLILQGSVRRNLAYALFRSAPPLPADRAHRATRREAARTGMPPHDSEGDWLDVTAAGYADRADFDQRMLALVAEIGMADDLVIAALATPLGGIVAADKRAALDQAREAVAAAIAGGGLDSIVEPPAPDIFAENLTILENILFALPEEADIEGVAVLNTPRVADALLRVGALDLLAAMGEDIARAFAGLAATVSPDSPLLDRVGSYARVDILGAAALAAASPAPGRRAGRARRQALIALAARYTAVRDRLDVLDGERIAAVMAMRAKLLAAPALPGLVRLDSVVPPGSMTVGEHLLGGRRRENRRAGWRRLEAALIEATADAGLRDMLLDIGLDCPMDAPVNPLTRQRIAVLRIALKRPHVVIANASSGAESVAMRDFLRQALPAAIIITDSDGAVASSEGNVLARLDEDGRLTVMAP